ncbi:hypothetical protein ABN214_15670 [Proteus terrae]|uniref:hypothetical protein n=1 Tax=Proteus terrae TaxID=1574161 RepID=UPI0032DAB8C4
MQPDSIQHRLDMSCSDSNGKNVIKPGNPSFIVSGSRVSPAIKTIGLNNVYGRTCLVMTSGSSSVYWRDNTGIVFNSDSIEPGVSVKRVGAGLTLHATNAKSGEDIAMIRIDDKPAIFIRAPINTEPTNYSLLVDLTTGEYVLKRGAVVVTSGTASVPANKFSIELGLNISASKTIGPPDNSTYTFSDGYLCLSDNTYDAVTFDNVTIKSHNVDVVTKDTGWSGYGDSTTPEEILKRPMTTPTLPNITSDKQGSELEAKFGSVDIENPSLVVAASVMVSGFQSDNSDADAEVTALFPSIISPETTLSSKSTLKPAPESQGYSNFTSVSVYGTDSGSPMTRETLDNITVKVRTKVK